jgi:SecD/SecF fusion protein
MKYSKTGFARYAFVLAAIIIGAGLLNPALGFSQETKPDSPPAAEKSDALTTPPATETAKQGDEKAVAPVAEKTADSAPAAAKKSETPPADAGAPSAAAAPPKEEAPRKTAEAGRDEEVPTSESSLPAGKTQPSVADKALQDAGLQDEARSGWSPWLVGLLILALFVLPTMAGNYLARMWRMPDHGWKLSLVIGMAAASILICLFGEFKFGPDLAGGITLIYEVADATVVGSDQDGQQGRADSADVKKGEREISLDKLVGALKRRIDPDGTKEITIRAYGPKAIEIIIPQVGQDEMEFVKQKITKIGQLEFRITADPTMQKDREVIELAKRVPPHQKDVFRGEAKAAEWVPYDVHEFGPHDLQNNFVKRMAGDTPEALVLMDPYNVTGDYLTRATKGIDETGGPAVHFSFNAQGASRFGGLTGANKPNPATPDVYRHLGIILDKVLLNAPVIRSRIESEGMISGGSMTDKEVELTVDVLNAGGLPAALNKTPISEDVISPTLGGVTVQKGKQAITWSLIGVVVFMIVYYRFSGIVASIGLALNLLMVLAVMVLIKAAFTLPGLAGLALTVGMSVDTNVLIYERIREELRSGAALRMAIRNGFGRAMTAIIDTHLTTIISGIVLFYVGTDQVKGFAVTLILGLVVNLFTAFFCTRVIFDVAERRGYIKKLKMMSLFAQPNVDFLRIRWVALGASWALILVGLVAVYFRGINLLDIDFTGGSSVAFTLNEPVPLPEVRKALAQTELEEKNLLVVARGTASTEYTVDTSEESVEKVKQVIGHEFGDKLKDFRFEYKDLKPIKEGEFTGIEAKLLINSGPGYEKESGLAHDALREQIVAQLAKHGHPGVQPTLVNPEYRRGSGVRFKEWTVRIAGLDEAAARAVFDGLQETMRDTPIFPLASKIGGRVSGDMQITALRAIAISLVAIIVYLWLRFAKPAYGIAAGVALIHDVLFTIGMLALSHYIVQAAPGVAQLLRIESFQINLTIVAALLTIIGFSVNDTIVTFDRLREIKGKSPNISAKMVNDAVNQTLSRTLLTVFTVFIVVVIMYFFGGEGLHSFAFAFLVGIITGTYSSIYIAAPVVLWLSGVSAAPAKEAPPQNVRGMQPAR